MGIIVSALMQAARSQSITQRKPHGSIMHKYAFAIGHGIEIHLCDGWWVSILKWYLFLTLRTHASLSTARAHASDPESIKLYFDLLEETLVENELMSRPGQIYNMNETGLPLDPKPPKTVGTKKAIASTSGDKSQITAVGCVMQLARPYLL